MLSKTDPKKSKSWQKLATHFTEIQNLHMNTLFADDPGRFENFSIRFNDVLVDFSKNRINSEDSGSPSPAGKRRRSPGCRRQHVQR